MATPKGHDGPENPLLEREETGRVLCPPEVTELSLMWCAEAVRAVCNVVTWEMLMANHGFKLPCISAHMAETCAESVEYVK